VRSLIARGDPSAILEDMSSVFRSGDSLMAFGPDLRVRSWNEELERLTGIPAAEALGRPCWDVVGAIDEAGGLICHAGCSGARLARQGWPLRSRRILLRTAAGPKLVTMATIYSSDGDGGPTCLHLFRSEDPADGGPKPAPASRLTPRQRQVLSLIADGLPAKTIAVRLGVAEVTVRNHIRAILLELGCHSQLEALAQARRQQLV